MHPSCEVGPHADAAPGRRLLRCDVLPALGIAARSNRSTSPRARSSATMAVLPATYSRRSPGSSVCRTTSFPHSHRELSMLHPPQETLDARALRAEVRGGNRPERAIPDAASAAPPRPHLRVRGPEKTMSISPACARSMNRSCSSTSRGVSRPSGASAAGVQTGPGGLGLLRLDILVRRESDSAGRRRQGYRVERTRATDLADCCTT
jgi:hypothetical protein